jgi:uncharacterized Ntn-hydrolase superfamily protein
MRGPLMRIWHHLTGHQNIHADHADDRLDAREETIRDLERRVELYEEKLRVERELRRRVERGLDLH